MCICCGPQRKLNRKLKNPKLVGNCCFFHRVGTTTSSGKYASQTKGWDFKDKKISKIFFLKLKSAHSAIQLDRNWDERKYFSHRLLQGQFVHLASQAFFSRGRGVPRAEEQYPSMVFNWKPFVNKQETRKQSLCTYLFTTKRFFIGGEKWSLWLYTVALCTYYAVYFSYGLKSILHVDVDRC